MRNRFDEQLAQLNREMIQMGALCQKTIAMTAHTLSREDPEARAQVLEQAEEIKQMEKSIETLCLKLLLQQQPVARDLRQISAALKMITDLSRIGDQASDIAEILPYLEGKTISDLEALRAMAQETITMVDQSVEAYVHKDLVLAQDVIAHDDVVDSYFVQIKESLTKVIAEHPTDGEYALDVLMVAKYFEKIGDHATNVASWVEFSVTGLHKQYS